MISAIGPIQIRRSSNVQQPPATRAVVASARRPSAPSPRVSPGQNFKIPSLQDVRDSIDDYLTREELLERLVSTAKWSYDHECKKQWIKDYLWIKYEDQGHREELLRLASNPSYSKLCRTLSTCLEAGYRGRRMRQTCRSFIDAVLFSPSSKAQAERNLRKWALARHEDRNGKPTWSCKELEADDKDLMELINCARCILRQDQDFVESLFAPEPAVKTWRQAVSNFFFELWGVVRLEFSAMICWIRRFLTSWSL